MWNVSIHKSSNNLFQIPPLWGIWQNFSDHKISRIHTNIVNQKFRAYTRQQLFSQSSETIRHFFPRSKTKQKNTTTIKNIAIKINFLHFQQSHWIILKVHFDSNAEMVLFYSLCHLVLDFSACISYAILYDILCQSLWHSVLS